MNLARSFHSVVLRVSLVALGVLVGIVSGLFLTSSAEAGHTISGGTCPERTVHRFFAGRPTRLEVL